MDEITFFRQVISQLPKHEELKPYIKITCGYGEVRFQIVSQLDEKKRTRYCINLGMAAQEWNELFSDQKGVKVKED